MKSKAGIFLIIVPILIVIFSIIYIEIVTDYFQNLVYTQKFAEVISDTQSFCAGQEEKYNLGYNHEEHPEVMYIDIDRFVYAIDSHYGVLAVVIDIDQEVDVTRRYYDGTPDFYPLEDKENVKILKDALYNETQGYVTLYWKGIPQKIYFQKLLVDNDYYFMLVAVNKDNTIEFLQLQRLVIPVSVAGVAFIIIAEYTTWLKLKQEKNRRKEE